MKPFLLAALVAAVSTPVLAAGPFDGTWKIDVASVAPPSKPNDFLLQNGSYSCRSCAAPFTVPADGVAHAISGDPYVDSVAIKIVDAHTVVETETKGGKTQWVYTMRVSDDGQSMTTEMVDTSAGNGVPARGIFHQARTKDAPAGAHIVSGTWQTTKYEGFSDSAIVFTLKTDGDSFTFSQPTGQFWTATLGGPAVPYKGDPGITTVSAARSGADTIVEADMRNGKIVSTNTMTTRDGRTMALVFVDKLRNSTQKLTATRQ
ncbi:MAG TPA: hypothetical protein VMF58_12720 [Rhizomicrobium sp.]|nr:hypothetical protein [Rhizomicrobium sp.]